MKRLTDLLTVLFFAVVLSACGKQSEESYAGQTKSPKATEQTATSGTVTEEQPVAASGLLLLRSPSVRTRVSSAFHSFPFDRAVNVAEVKMFSPQSGGSGFSLSVGFFSPDYHKQYIIYLTYKSY